MMQIVRRLLGGSRGSAAVEFALVAPVFITLLLCGAEYGRALSIDRRLTITTRTVADLTGQYTQMSSSDDATVLNVSSQVMAPFSTAPLQIVLSVLATDAVGITRVSWSKSLPDGHALTVGQIISMPLGSVLPGGSVIYSQTAYAYTPMIGGSLIGNLNMSDQIIMSPRFSPTVTQTGS